MRSPASPPDTKPPPAGSRFLAYLQLLRLPNVFTALADVTMGFLVVEQSLSPLPVFLLLAGASTCLYLAGMVLNDFYDYEVDLRERPQRPLPSGRISLGAARRLGYGLLLSGVLLGWLAGFAAAGRADIAWRSGVMATILAACVLLYDAVLKPSVLGPVVMGTCRLCNVLLGMSAGRLGGSSWFGYDRSHLLIAVGIGIYIVGVTWFARTEAARSKRGLLGLGVSLMGAGILVLAVFPRLASGEFWFRLDPDTVWPGLLCLLLFSILSRCLLAIADPQPQTVQRAVKHCILSLITLDASLVLLAAPWPFAVGVLALLVPTMLLGKWVYST